MDAIILAGGRGERLRGVWDRAKCLVPIGSPPHDQPVLAILLRRLQDLKPRRTILLLGHRSEDVEHFLRNVTFLGLGIVRIVESDPRGTAQALRLAIAHSNPTEALVLNGDTLPDYDLGSLVEFRRNIRAPIAAAWSGGRYAGAAAFDEDGLLTVYDDRDVLDLVHFLGGAARYKVPGYLDVGTPDNFELARHKRENAL